jgi:flagellar protein FliO/FliZ
MKHRCGLSLGLFLAPWAALAAEAPSAGTNLPSSTTGGLLQMLLALLFVLVVIFALAWLLRRFGPSQLGAGGVLKVLGGVAVGPRERLVLVEVGETWLIVGVAPGQVSTVHAMERPTNLPPQTTTGPTGAAFAERLKQMLGSRQT